MTILARPAPDSGLDIVHGELARQLPRIEALRGAGETGTPLPIYLASPAAGGTDPLAAAKIVGWEYPVVGGQSLGLARLHWRAGKLVFGGLTYGWFPELLSEAATLAEQTLTAADGDFEPRLLQMPAVGLSALWLHGQTQDRFVILEKRARPLTLDSDLQPRIKAAIAGARPARSHTPLQKTPKPVGGNMRLSISILLLAVVTVAFATSWAGFLPLVWAWAAELALILGLFCFLGVATKRYWFGILVDGRNKISLSRLQISLWTILFVSTFLILYVWNIGHAGADISAAFGFKVPSTIWLLMGMSGFSAAAGPAILSAKPANDPTAPTAPLKDPAKFVDGVVVKRNDDAVPQWSDVILGDDAGNAEAIDISKVQQLLLSGVAVVAYGYVIGHTLAASTGVVSGLPDMSDGFLALIGASHATYLAYKGVSHSN